MAQIDKPAPDFSLEALVGSEFKTLSLSDYKGKYVVLFFYPLDFTFVCPTEILAFNDRVKEFKAIDCEVIGASVDSAHCHYGWTQSDRKNGGLGGPLDIPLIGDLNKTLAADYGCLLDSGHTSRGLYIINREGVVVHITNNSPPVGRNVDEVLRLVKGYQFVDAHGEVCPINWTPGDATIKPNHEEKGKFFSA